MDAEELNERIAEVNPERLDAYQRMFERILLFNLAAYLMPKEHIEETIKFAEKVIKKTIDVDTARRDEYLYTTKEGRLARLNNEPDGEELRLNFLKTWAVAKDIIYANLQKVDGPEDTGSTAD